MWFCWTGYDGLQTLFKPFIITHFRLDMTIFVITPRVADASRLGQQFALLSVTYNYLVISTIYQQNLYLIYPLTSRLTRLKIKQLYFQMTNSSNKT